MKADLAARLAADAAIAALVANGPDGEPAIGWYGFSRGDGYPAIALSTITPGEEWTHDGPDPIERPRVRFDLRATTPAVLESLGEAVKAAMRLGGDQGDTRFHPATLEGDRPIDLGEQDGGEALFQLQLEFMFYHEEI
jgi:hypothetical protein